MKRVGAGLAAGGVAAVIAALVSLPLDSPDDLFFNTGSVAIAALLLGLVGGILWRMLDGSPREMFFFGAAAVVGFVAAAIVAVVVQAFLFDDAVAYMLPLAAIVFAVVGLLTPLLSSLRMPERPALGAYGACAAAGLVLGLALSGIGDEESGRLELPDDPQAVANADSEVVTPDDVEGVAFSVVPGESALTYTVREKLANLPADSDAVGRTSEVSGEVYLDGTPSVITVDLSTLESDQGRRDNFVRTNVFGEQPLATFTADTLPALPAEYMPGETFTGSLPGILDVQGAQVPITLEIEARLQGDELQVVGRVDTTWDELQIPPPNTPIVTVREDVHIEVLIIARRAA
jgi:hypothetical protein